MRPLLPLALALLLVGCATDDQLPVAAENFFTGTQVMVLNKTALPKTSPDSVTFAQTLPKRHTAVLGEVTVNEYNLFGIKRQLAVVTRLLQEKAASIGGNVVYKAHETNNDTLSAQVLAYQMHVMA